MTVTGTEQRVYGTLVGGCIIDLHRFALVSGSTAQSPIEATTVTYADTTPYKQCGYKYAGYLTLFLSISGSTVYAAIEVRICKNDAKRIVIETYGEVANTVTGGMSLWFNKGSDKHFPTRDDFPETGSNNVNYIDDATDTYYIWNETIYEEGSCWVKLNSTTSEVIMPYATTSYTFKESKRNGSTTIDCCKKCPSCGCKTCNITGLSLTYKTPDGSSGTVTPSTISSYGYTNNGDYTAFFASQKSFIEYKLKCDSLQFWIGDTGSHESQNKLYYTDMDTGEVHLLGTLEPGQATGTITTSFPFDYLKNCIIEVQCKLCGNYIIIDKNNIGNNKSQQILNCLSINREIRIVYRLQQFTEIIDYLAIISNIIDTNDNIYIKCNDITSNRGIKLGPTVYYTLDNIFTLYGYSRYPFGPNYNNAHLMLDSPNFFKGVTLAKTTIRGGVKIDFDYEFELITTTASGTTIVLEPTESFMWLPMTFYQLNEDGSRGVDQPFLYTHYPSSNVGHITLDLSNLINTSYAYENFYGEIELAYIYIQKFVPNMLDSYPARTDGYITISNLRLYDCCNKLINPGESKFSAHKDNTHSLAFKLDIL